MTTETVTQAFSCRRPDRMASVRSWGRKRSARGLRRRVCLRRQMVLCVPSSVFIPVEAAAHCCSSRMFAAGIPMGNGRHDCSGSSRWGLGMGCWKTACLPVYFPQLFLLSHCWPPSGTEVHSMLCAFILHFVGVRVKIPFLVCSTVEMLWVMASVELHCSRATAQ